ncbi:RNA polymerase sigma factor [Ferrimonas sediminicola]|uniref:RNA polymerase sigma factor n=1 Tax=Ferrimonas sediminicola TaxID=2569538 RepID=A0A4U1BET6_9GAMM|nr:RNA polymerase sigma factor [Ferrimonas sediminicola]TKB49385.1 RNA polymerase sigma factor [Ferrimonas sediminicola]
MTGNLPPNRADEADLALEIRRAQEGDREAFARLYRRYSPRVYALCLRLSGRVASAEEATQEVFIRLWQKLPQFRFDAQFTTWLHRLTLNHALNYLKGQPQLAPLSEPELQRQGEVMEELQLVDRLLPRLPERARQVFVLHAIEGYHHHEVARLLQIQPGTSKAQYHRARQLLQEMLI